MPPGTPHGHETAGMPMDERSAVLSYLSLASLNARPPRRLPQAFDMYRGS